MVRTHYNASLLIGDVVYRLNKKDAASIGGAAHDIYRHGAHHSIKKPLHFHKAVLY